MYLHVLFLMNVPNFIIKHVMLRPVYQHHASNFLLEQQAAQQLAPMWSSVFQPHASNPMQEQLAAQQPAPSLSLSMLKNIQQNFHVKHNLTLY